MNYEEDLIAAFKNIGVPIRAYDIPIILRLGADRYLNQIRVNTNEENLSTIYIVLNELRQLNAK